MVCDTPRKSSMPPSVTMNGCSLSRVINKPWPRPISTATPSATGNADPERVAQAADLGRRELGDEHARQADHRSDRQIDAAGDDHERDADREDPEHRDLARGVDRRSSRPRNPGSDVQSARHISDQRDVSFPSSLPSPTMPHLAAAATVPVIKVAIALLA